MADPISLGKNGNTGKIDFSKIKAGIKKEELVKNDARLESVFDKVDENKDGILDRGEIETLKKQVSSWAGTDENLKKNEINDERFASRKDKKALLEFLNKLDGVTPEDVEKVETKTVNNEQVEVLTFKDGHTEEYYPNGQKISTVVQGNKKTKTTEMNGTVTSEVVTENEGEENEIISTTSIVNGQKQTVINNKGDKTTSTINYDGDKKSNATIVGENSKIVITYDSDGNPAKEVETSGTSEKTYIYKDGQKVLRTVIENKGVAGKETIKNYDSEGGYTQTQDVGSGVVTTVADKDGNVTDCKKTETINGQEVSLQLDKNGNIPGVIVQNGESLSAIAKKFGCSVDDLVKLNQEQLKGKGKNQYFEVGSEIKLPNSVGIEKFQKAQEGRKPAEVAKAEYARDAQIRQQKAAEAKQKAAVEQQEREYYKKLGVKSFVNKGEKVKDKKFGQTFEVIGQLDYGRKLVRHGNAIRVMSHDDVILKDEYIEAHKAYVSMPKNVRNNTASGKEGITYVKDSKGNVWYFDAKTGKALANNDYKNMVKQETAFVANQLYTAAQGSMGTDEEKLEKGIKNIYSRDILKGVNAELKTKDTAYAGDKNTMPVEALILDEMSHGSARPLLKTLIDSGTMTAQEQARTVKRELEHELHGGFGITKTKDVNEVMQMVGSREVRLELERQFNVAHPELEANDGSVVRSYIAGDGWNAQEVDQFDANWVKNGAYAEAQDYYQVDENGALVVDDKGNPVIVHDAGDQAHRDAVLGRLIFDYDDKEALNKGLDAINDNPNSYDYQNFIGRAKAKCDSDKTSKFKERFSNQDYGQRYLAGFYADSNGNVDAGNLCASNTILFKGEKPARVRAEEILYSARQGEATAVFEEMESPETYKTMADLIAKGEVKGVKSLKDLYNNAVNEINNRVVDGAGTPNGQRKLEQMKANAMLSGEIEFSKKEVTDYCVKLMHSIDTYAGAGASKGATGAALNNADYATLQLQSILQAHPEVLSDVKARVEKESFISTSQGSGTATIAAQLTKTDNKAKYLDMIKNTTFVSNEEIFYDENGKQITDTEQIQQIKDSNMQDLNNMRQYVAELEREFKKGVDAQGTFSNVANSVATHGKLGTDRGDVENKYRNAKLMLSQFEAAAQGKLRDSNGKVVSPQDLAKQMVDKQNKLAQANSDYTQTIEYTKMGIVLAPVLVASGGAGAAVSGGVLVSSAASGLVAGATTYGVNAIEYNTSYTGNTAEAREQNLEDSVVAAATTAMGAGQMKYIGNMANGMGKIARTSIRVATAVGADTAVGAGAEYATTGDISQSGVISNALTSAAGNLAGAKSMGKKQPAPKAKILDNATVNGDKAIGGAFSDKNFPKVRTEVRQELGSGVTPDRAAHIYKEADKVQIMNSKQGKALKHEVETASGFETHHKLRTATDKKGEAVVEKINENVSRTSETILAEKNSGALAPHDAATLEDNLVNNLNTKEQIEQFKAQLKERVGADANGNMFKYEVQGKDHAADLMAKADKKLKQLADFDDVMATIPEKGGIGDMTAIKSFVNKPSTTAEQLDALIAKMEANPALKKFGGSKKLIADMKTRSEILKAKNTSLKAPKEPVQSEVKSEPKADEVVKSEVKPKTVEESKITSNDDVEVKQPVDDSQQKSLNDGDLVEEIQTKPADETPSVETPTEKTIEEQIADLDEKIQTARANGENTAELEKQMTELKAKRASEIVKSEVDELNAEPPVVSDEAQLSALEKEIKDLDGQIDSLNKQIETAKKNGQSTAELDKKLDDLKMKRAEKIGRSETIEVKDDVTPINESAPVETPKVESKEVIDTVNSIPEAQIPAQHRSLWKSCKAKISNLMKELSMPTVMNPKELMARGREILSNLKTIYDSISNVSLKSKIKKITNNIKSMLTGSTAQHNAFKLVTSEKDAMKLFDDMVVNRTMNFDHFDKSMEILKDGKPYFIDIGSWRYEIHESSGTGNFITDYQKMNDKINTKWKMHIYADSPQEWANAAQVAMPYLRKNKIMYKTMQSLDADEFNAIRNSTNSEGFKSQRGKAFTIYFENEEQFLQTAKNLEARFKESGLKSSGTVANEAQIGDSGFLSYRHEGAERGTQYKPDGVEDPYLKSLQNNQVKFDEPIEIIGGGAFNSGERGSIVLDLDTTPKPKQNVGQFDEPIEIIGGGAFNPQLTPDQKILIGEIGQRINNIRFESDVRPLQAKIDRLPDCPQKRRLQSQLNMKNRELTASASSPINNSSSQLGQFDDSNLVVSSEAIRPQLTPQQKAVMDEIGQKINNIRFESDVSPLQAKINRLPDCPQKTQLQKQLDRKVKELSSAPAANSSTKINTGKNSNMYTIPDGFEFTASSPEVITPRRNAHATTNITNVKPADVHVSGTVTGFSFLSETSNLQNLLKDNRVALDLRNSLRSGNSKVAVGYVKDCDVTVLTTSDGVLDSFRRPGCITISLKGQVSEVDGLRLLSHLKEKGLITQLSDSRQASVIAKKIQEEVANFFNGLN